jgi:HEAT repeat protein
MQRSERKGERAGVVLLQTPAPVIFAKSTRPAAMEDPKTYAAVRLKQIKANPAPWTEPWAWRKEFAEADSPELQREVLALAKQVGHSPLISVLALALASEDGVVRLDAARSIVLLSEERLRDGFAIGVEAADPEIREEVMDLIYQIQPHLRPELLRVAMAASAADVQLRAIAFMSEHPSPDLFAVLIEGLRTSTAEVRPRLDEAFNDLVQFRFGTFEEAATWWAQNRSEFDDLMTRIQ